MVNVLQDQRLAMIKRFDINDKYRFKAEITSDDFHKQYSSFQKTIRRDVQNVIMNSLLLRPSFCLYYDNEESYKESINDSYFMNGSLLTNSVLSVVMNENGKLRGTGLGEINEWKSSLRDLKQVLWNNAELTGSKYDLLKNNIEMQLQHADILLTEIDAISNLKNNQTEYHQPFFQIVELVKSYAEKLENGSEMNKTEWWTTSYMLNSFCAVTELNLLTYFPEMDPVKKCKLKSRYISEDIEHLQKILQSYKFMSIVMDYKDLGDETRELFECQIEDLQEAKEKYSKKVAIRPEVCMYIRMVKDMTHFLKSCCHPKALLELLTAIESELDPSIDYIDIKDNMNMMYTLQRIDELISKIDLWVSNANKFEHHTLIKYSAHYRDFISPIECSIANFKHGLLGLKHHLNALKSSIIHRKNDSYFDITDNLTFQKIMDALIEFPSCKMVDLFADEEKRPRYTNIFSILTNTTESEDLYFKLIKTRMQAIQNTVTTNKNLSLDKFIEFNKTLNVCNQIWHRQEEIRKKKQAEEDSLYVTKTKCAEEDEELVKLQEIHEMFPNYADEDFGEFVQDNTLEKIIKIDKTKKAKHLHDIITAEDYEFVGESFVKMMGNHANGQLISYLDIFSSKFSIFHQLYVHHKKGLLSETDDAAYSSLILVVSLAQESYDDLLLRSEITFNSFANNFLMEKFFQVKMIRFTTSTKTPTLLRPKIALTS